MSADHWTEHLSDEEKALLSAPRPVWGQRTTMDVVLLRLARERAHAEALGRMLQETWAKNLPEPDEKDEAWARSVIASPETQRDLQLLTECHERGGCTYGDPVEGDMLWGSFPHVRCTHCGCSTEYKPELELKAGGGKG